MFCPECGKPLADETVRTCPYCGTSFFVPEQPEERTSAAAEKPQRTGRSKRSAAALLFGTGTFVFGTLTALGKLLGFDLRILYGTAACAFFLAPLACCFGLFGIVARAKDREKRGLPSAIAGLLLGLVFGLLAAYCLLIRIFRA